MAKRVMTAEDVIEQKVRSFQGDVALNFPRAALHYLGATAGESLQFKILGEGTIVVSKSSAPSIQQMPIESIVPDDEVAGFVEHRATRPRRGRPPTRRRWRR